MSAWLSPAKLLHLPKIDGGRLAEECFGWDARLANHEGGMGMETGANGLESLIACLVVTLDFDGHHPILLLDDVVHLVIAIAPIEYAIIICEGVADDVRTDGRLEIGAPRFWVCDRRLEGLVRE